MLCSSNEFQIRDGLLLISDTVNSSASYPTVLGSTLPDADLTDRGAIKDDLQSSWYLASAACSSLKAPCTMILTWTRVYLIFKQKLETVQCSITFCCLKYRN